MPGHREDVAIDRSTALLILDMVNSFDYPNGAAIARAATGIAPVVARLRQQVKRHGGACIYVNDNFGLWQADFRELVARAQVGRGADIMAWLKPAPDDAFILKLKHSAFFQTPLPLFLQKFSVRRLIVAGVEAESCVLATALDAHMREYAVQAPSNAMASPSPARKTAALRVLRHAGVQTRAFAAARGAR